MTNYTKKLIFWATATVVALIASEMALYYNERMLWVFLMIVEFIGGFTTGNIWGQRTFNKRFNR